MYLFLDNTATEELVFFVSEDGRSFREYRKISEAEGGIPQALSEILLAEKLKLADLAGIAVRVGVGRFTATRVAVVFANTMAYALQLPVAAVHSSEPSEAFKILMSTPKGKYILAEYSAEPRIGKKI